MQFTFFISFILCKILFYLMHAKLYKILLYIYIIVNFYVKQFVSQLCSYFPCYTCLHIQRFKQLLTRMRKWSCFYCRLRPCIAFHVCADAAFSPLSGVRSLVSLWIQRAFSVTDVGSARFSHHQAPEIRKADILHHQSQPHSRFPSHFFLIQFCHACTPGLAGGPVDIRSAGVTCG